MNSLRRARTARITRVVDIKLIMTAARDSAAYWFYNTITYVLLPHSTNTHSSALVVTEMNTEYSLRNALCLNSLPVVVFQENHILCCCYVAVCQHVFI